jgi:hypothetical protein
MIGRNLMSALEFDERLGLVTIFFGGNLRMLDPFNFDKVIWVHEEENGSLDPSQSKQVTFACSGYSLKMGLLAVGGVDGKIFLFDLQS